jgi:transposase-like protein
MLRPRKRHSPDFKARVFLVAIRGLKTNARLASELQVHPVQISQWKRRAPEHLPAALGREASRPRRSESELTATLFKELPMFQWINTVLGNLKTGFSGAYHSFDFGKYAERYLGTIAYRFNRRFDLPTLPTRLLVAATACGPRPEPWIRRVADVPC